MSLANVSRPTSDDVFWSLMCIGNIIHFTWLRRITGACFIRTPACSCSLVVKDVCSATSSLRTGFPTRKILTTPRSTYPTPSRTPSILAKKRWKRERERRSSCRASESTSRAAAVSVRRCPNTCTMIGRVSLEVLLVVCFTAMWFTSQER